MIDRRWHLRIKTSAQVVVVGASSPCLGTLRDLSCSGARVQLASGQVRRGTTLDLLLQLSGRAYKRVRAKVVSSGPDGVGLKFDDVLDRSFFHSLALRSLSSSI